MNVVAADPAGPASLTYTWSVVGTPPGSVSFNPNGTNPAQTTTATFTTPGTYTLLVTVADPAQLTTTSQVTFTSNPVLTTITVAPATATVQDGTTQQFKATALDQFGQPLAAQPTFTWSVDTGGLGTVSSSGLYTAPASGTGSATVRATSGTVSGTASVTVTAAIPIVTITEFPIPTSHAVPVGITAGPDGNVWFTEDQASKIGRITPVGVVTEFALPPPLPQNDASTRGPYGITLGRDGNLWFVENFGPYDSVGKITPAGVVTEFVIPTVNSVPWSITSGPDGNLWFTEQSGNKIGRINPTTGAISEFTVPTPGSQPACITAGPDGNLWFTELGGGKVGRITPAGTITEFPVAAGLFGITAGADGNLWFSNLYAGQLGRINPFTTAVTLFALPPGQPGSPGYLTTGPDGNVWFGETGNAVGRITPGGVITTYSAPSAGAWIQGITAGPDGNVWFTENLTEHIGRVNLGNPHAALNPLSSPPTNLPAVASALAHSLEHYDQFITHAYLTYLGRSPAASEVAGWAGLMQNGLSDEQLEAGFIGSAEYIADHGGQGAGWVTGMYHDLLGRSPAQAEVDGWMTALNNGTTPQQVAYGFAASPEREGQRVNNDYMTLLGRPASQAEVDGWVNAFVHGTTNEDVIAGFVGSPEYFDNRGQGDPSTWLASAYNDVLGRKPSPDEVTAWLAWLP
jgi:virginiamycin B lyase